MTSHAFGASPLLNIAAAERDTGLSKDTLRVWERRYGFPVPLRDRSGERLYSAEQIEQLRLLKRLVDAGERPGQLMSLSMADLRARLEHRTPPEAVNAPRDVDEFVDLLQSHDIDAFRRHLSHARERLGLARFVTDVVAPLNTRVGDAWMRGQLQVYQEHLYTESVQTTLRDAIARIPQGVGGPRVLLTTLPLEPHGLGLLMAEALMALAGARCVSLGVCTPVWDIVMASATQHADIVALSFSGCMNPNQVVEGLRELRAKLPATVTLWAGGSAPVLHRRPVPGVRAIAAIGQIRDELAAWATRTPED
ncbi:MerR family transcriptional regulator [uncultured Piscinibacter sp.]|uniref:MerR family transcriptional regulator n=1 Tax=uncultured Piscinibacter sp. TaxID=1131835 RepID=UPI00262D5E78|nr:MerR family transcriptional regulator [uncultured Piscinibacter sp.]